jgi:hypothetical protein
MMGAGRQFVLEAPSREAKITDPAAPVVSGGSTRHQTENLVKNPFPVILSGVKDLNSLEKQNYSLHPE